MQILVTTDNDGHFNAAYPSDRNNVIKLLEKIHDGDYYYDIINDNCIELPDDFSTMCCQDWNEFINHFTLRGTLEYVEIPDIIPKACACE